MTKNLRNEILIESKDIAMKENIAPLHKEGYLEFIKNGNRLNFERLYFDRRRQLVTLALSVYLEKDKAVISMLESLITAICDEFTWALPAHLTVVDGDFHEDSPACIDLFAAETGQSLAEIIEVLSNDLTPALKERVAFEVDRRILTPLEKKEWHWEKLENNWSSVIAGCIGMTALSILPLKNPRQIAIINRLSVSFDSYFKGFYEDGVCIEGVSYLAYGFGYYFYFAQKYSVCYNDDIYLDKALVRNLAEFPYYTQVGDAKYVDFADNNKCDMPTGLLSLCNKKFGVKIPKFHEANGLHFDHCYRWAELYRNLIWTDSSDSADKDEVQKRYFKDSMWFILRNVCNNFIFALKGGRNDESHNHNDLGHFVIASNHEDFLIDLGAGEYTKYSFDLEYRYQILNNRSLGHSVPVINDYEQPYGNYYANCINYEDTPDRKTKILLDLTHAYPADAKIANYTRNFTIEDKQRKSTIIDKISFENSDNTNASSVVKQCFISYKKPVLKENTVLWIGNEDTLCLHISNHDSTKISANEIIDHSGKNIVVYRLELLSETTGYKNVYEHKHVFELIKNKS